MWSGFQGIRLESFRKCWGGIEVEGQLLTEIPPAVYYFFFLFFWSFFFFEPREEKSPGLCLSHKGTERPGNIQTPPALLSQDLLINKGDSNRPLTPTGSAKNCFCRLVPARSLGEEFEKNRN